MFAHRSAGAGVVSALVLLAVAAVFPPPAAAAFSTGPSAFCHVTDGAFTDCTPGGGVEEWSDISFLAGLGTSAGAVVYTDQSTAPPRLLLMYDLLLHQEPLPVDSFFDITFNIFEHGELELYEVRCFGDNTFRVFEDGEDITEEADTVDCAVGFNGHNVQVELEIDTLVTYSPDIPLFWSTAAPQPRPCPPGEPGCQPQPLAPPGFVETSSTIVIASSDGTTKVAGLPVGGITPASLCDRATGAGVLVDLLGLLAGGNHGRFVSQVAHDARMALASLADFGIIAPSQIGALHGCVVSTLGK
ncbi:MAG TPA: hypothetical protein VGC93_07715 [Thermoanaerobaculia bacterium]